MEPLASGPPFVTSRDNFSQTLHNAGQGDSPVRLDYSSCGRHNVANGSDNDQRHWTSGFDVGRSLSPSIPFLGHAADLDFTAFTLLNVSPQAIISVPFFGLEGSWNNLTGFPSQFGPDIDTGEQSGTGSVESASRPLDPSAKAPTELHDDQAGGERPAEQSPGTRPFRSRIGKNTRGFPCHHLACIKVFDRACDRNKHEESHYLDNW